MAAWPCLYCDQRFTGEAKNLYLQAYEGDDCESYRFVVCPGCVTEILDIWRTRALWRDQDRDWNMPDGSGEPVQRLMPPGGPPRRSKGHQR